MIMPDSPTLAVMVSLSTSQPMSKIKERKVTLNPACHTSGRAEPFSTVNGYDLFMFLLHGRLLRVDGL